MSENIDFSKRLINNYVLLDKCDNGQPNGHLMQYLLFNVLLCNIYYLMYCYAIFII